MSDLDQIHKQRIFLRKKMRQLRGEKGGAGTYEDSLAKTILGSELLEGHQSIGIYYSVGHELPTHNLMHVLTQKGFDVSLPCVEKKDMAFRSWRPGQELDENRYAVPQPFKDKPLAQPSLLFVPLLAFDSRGHRLGYGKGYYDRYLSQNLTVRRIGLAFSFQELTLLPELQHDVPLECVVSVNPHGAIEIKSSG